MALKLAFEEITRARRETGICETCGQKMVGHTRCEACGVMMGQGHMESRENNYRGHVLCDSCVADWKEFEANMGRGVSWPRFLYPTGRVGG